MSHFPVTVCLPPMAADKVSDALNSALAPFDENLETAPRRKYLENWNEDWQRAIQYFGEHPDEKPAGLDELNIAAALSAYLGEEIGEESPEGSPVTLYYWITTSNEQAKWDYWCVGGRWGRRFHPRDGNVDSPLLIRAERGWNSPKTGPRDTVLVEGGPVGLLDFTGQRQSAAQKACDTYDRWTALVDGLPAAEPWSVFYERYAADHTGYPIDRVRQEYHAQPRVAAALTCKEFRGVDDVIGHFAPDRETFAQRAASQAVPGFALIDLDGDWTSPGRMGWFGMSSATQADRDAYFARANAYLDALPDDAWLVVVDCHI